MSLRALHILNEVTTVLSRGRVRDICVFRSADMASVFVTGTGFSERHNYAIAHDLIKHDPLIKVVGRGARGTITRENRDWLCIRFDNVFVSVLTQDVRDSVELEKMHILEKYDDQYAEMVHHFKMHELEEASK